MDEIRIDNLEIYAYHGLLSDEREFGQTFYVNAVLYLDLERAGREDDITYSVDYAKVSHTITDVMQREKYFSIERAADAIAYEILMLYQNVREVSVEVRKPHAPIGLPFESVSAKIHRAWHKVMLSIGSNLGDRELYLDSAIEAMKTSLAYRNVKVSSVIETKPYGGVEQGDFLNAAISLETLETPKGLLNSLHELENKAERTREIHWGPRTLDLDILFYDKLVYEDEDLIIPHVDLENREFVLAPLNEIEPNYRHPILGKTVSQMLANLRAKQA